MLVKCFLKSSVIEMKTNNFQQHYFFVNLFALKQCAKEFAKKKIFGLRKKTVIVVSEKKTMLILGSSWNIHSLWNTKIYQVDLGGIFCCSPMVYKRISFTTPMITQRHLHPLSIFWKSQKNILLRFFIDAIRLIKLVHFTFRTVLYVQFLEMIRKSV